MWSPHGDRIAFNRWQRDGTGDWQVRPTHRDRRWRPRLGGVAPAADGAPIDWSPDGRSIPSLPKTSIDAYGVAPDATGSVARPVIIDVADGFSRRSTGAASVASWQRQAPRDQPRLPSGPTGHPVHPLERGLADRGIDRGRVEHQLTERGTRIASRVARGGDGRRPAVAEVAAPVDRRDLAEGVAAPKPVDLVASTVTDSSPSSTM